MIFTAGMVILAAVATGVVADSQQRDGLIGAIVVDREKCTLEECD
jgi:hypothetical protein